MTHAISVSHLKKIYPNKVSALKGISLTVDKGDFFALLGPNGAGKSTAIGIISSLVTKTEGTVSVYGHNLDTDPETAKSMIGLVPQEINFNPFEKVIDIILNQAGYYGIPRKIAAVQAEHYLKKLNLWEKRNTIGLRLSGGMKRRLMIARALVHEPPLLILDEPTAGVDIELRHAMWQFLAELNQKGTTIILTTHYLEEAESLCKNVAIIDHGEIIENTSMKSLLNRINVQTLLLDLKNPLTHSIAIDDYNSRALDEVTLEVEVKKGQSLNHLFSELSKYHLEIISMRNKTNRLEELFVRLISENKT